jgi:hypothetical protein
MTKVADEWVVHGEYIEQFIEGANCHEQGIDCGCRALQGPGGGSTKLAIATMASSCSRGKSISSCSQKLQNQTRDNDVGSIAR